MATVQPDHLAGCMHAMPPGPSVLASAPGWIASLGGWDARLVDALILGSEGSRMGSSRG
jgi:hypothetical protein